MLAITSRRQQPWTHWGQPGRTRSPIQFLLPGALTQLLPLTSVALVPSAVLTGLAVGGWIALIFALRPLLALRNVSPLQTLRRDTDANVLRMRWSDLPRIVVNVALILSVVLIALMRAQTAEQALWISGATGLAILALAVSAAFLTWSARKGLRTRWPYVVRQEWQTCTVPGNQTRAVTLALVIRRISSSAHCISCRAIFFGGSPAFRPKRAAT